TATVSDPMAHEFPVAFFHLLNGFGIDLTDSGVQCHSAFETSFGKHVGNAPEPNSNAILSGAEVDHIRPGRPVRIKRSIGSRVERPDFDIRCNPDCERFPSGPSKGLSFDDQ